MSKKGIVVVSFGTTYPEARYKAITATEKAIQNNFGDWQVVRAFTSKIVRQRIYQNERVVISNPEQVLANLAQNGYQEVAVQPLHIIPGTEFNLLKQAVLKYKSCFSTIKLSKPLLTQFSDYQKITQFIQRPREAEAGNLWMGHGSSHSAFATYACLDHMLLNTNSFLGAVESYPDINVIIQRIKHTGIKEIYLQPFMLVAGNHAHLDMASQAADSWKSKLEHEGIKVIPELKGLGEYPEIQAMFIAKLQHTLERN